MKASLRDTVVAAVAASTAIFPSTALAQDPRPMENLGRGVVAVRSSEEDVLIGWRLLGLDPEDIGFNVYRSTGDGDPELLNPEVITNASNFVDSGADLSDSNTYYVSPVLGGEEQDASATFTLAADNEVEPAVRIPIRDNGPIKFVWVGDLDGDGEYDFVLDRTNTQQSIEAYTGNGTFLWEVGLGPNSENQDNIEPGSATICVGHWDGVTVYDFDSDGKAEVAVRIANGVQFGDGETFEHDNDDEQFIAILDGLTGGLRGTSQLPTDYIDDGPLASRLAVGYLDGVTPHVVGWFKNRQPDDGDFNRLMGAWTFDGSEVSEQWIWYGDSSDAADGHNTRVLDVDGDGVDEVLEIGFALKGDGSILYELPIVHGDRYYIAKMDPEQEGLQGYGIQQDHPEAMMEYYYDAGNGTIIWEHFADQVGDAARGMAGDIDPTRPGYEVWSFSGLYNAPSNELIEEDTELQPWPHLSVWWDGDQLMELFNDGKFEKWDWENPTDTSSTPRLFDISDYGAANMNGVYPGFIGDILGDWREEVIVMSGDYSELVIFTTDQPTDIRLYTLAHNPAYRNDMTVKGYLQSHHVDYFLGHDMSMPPQPNIRYVE
ncbi:hypothetical protein FQN54_000608 [Arachnomyces sp. PD_36]|nr:hypothetical protein FQN54_000608 [Arachnomyces sp. PD_36]